MERREVTARSNVIIRRCARYLSETRVTPNQISVASVLFSLLVPGGLFWLGGTLGVLVAAAGIQLRLLANVLDGLVAIEGAKSSAVGSLYNEIPDRVSDSIVLIALGYASLSTELGWAAALLAALTAYVRVVGGALQLPQSFLGPMAKQHRMAVATVTLLITTMLSPETSKVAHSVGLAVIILGSAATCVLRLREIAHRMSVQV